MFCLEVITNLKFYKHCFVKDDLQKHFLSQDGVLFAKEIHRLGPMVKKYKAWKETHDCDLTADKVSILSPTLSLRLLSQLYLF